MLRHRWTLMAAGILVVLVGFAQRVRSADRGDNVLVSPAATLPGGGKVSELQLLRAAAEGLHAPYYVWSTDGKLLMANQGWAEATGLDRAKSLGKSCKEIFPAAMAERFLAVNRDVVKKGAPTEAEEFVDRPDGHHTYLTLKYPVRDRSGKVIGVGGVSLEEKQH